MTEPQNPDRRSLVGRVKAPGEPGIATLSDEVLAAYIDGRLPGEARRAVDTVVASDPEAYAWLIEAVAVTRELPADALDTAPAATTGPHRRRLWPLAAAGLATAAALTLVMRGTVVPAASPDQILVRLAAEAGAPSFTPWLSGGFAVSARPALRGGASRSPSSAVLASVVDLETVVARGPSPVASHALGVALLVAGGDSRAEALVRLEDAAAADPRPAYLSDAGAAYLERAIRTGSSADAELALERTTRALVIAPRLPEALYNRALALQTLNRHQDAIEAWTTFLATSEGPAHGPAREHLARLRARLEPTTPP